MCCWVMFFKRLSSIFHLWYTNHEIRRKKLAVLKKNSWKNLDPNIFYDEISEFFSKKKSKFFFKIFFLKVVHSTLKRRQKKIFFWKKSRPRFRPNFRFLFLQWHRVVSKKSIFFYFFSLFTPKRTVLDPCESDPATSPHYERA